MRKRFIGVFSGSFNPIHTGHLMIANYMREFTSLDEIWFVVSPHNPLKEQAVLLDDKMRLEMVDLALRDYEGIKMCDIEFDLPRPSYTIDTLSELENKYPDFQFILIIGGDNWRVFNQWKDYEKLLMKYQIIIYPRQGEFIEIPPEFYNNVQLVNAPVVEVSSTFIRDSIRKGKNVQAFVPSRVYEYIEKHKLYR